VSTDVGSGEETPVLLTPRIRSALFEIHATDPQQAPRLMVWVIAVLFAALLFWQHAATQLIG
jgi:hypothetical protein